MHQVIIVGSGPAGHTAALYLARANVKPLVFEGSVPGGLLTTTKTVENFPGFPEGIDGYELTERIAQQSKTFGAETVNEVVQTVFAEDGYFKVETTCGKSYNTKSIIVATGSTPKKLNVQGFAEYWMKGISSCAVCDGGLPCFRDVPIAVVGGGDSACEEALYLSRTASIVYLIHRRDSLRASKIMADRVLSNKKIQVIWDTTISEIKGERKINALVLDTAGSRRELSVRGLFLAIGHTPNAEIVKDLVEVDLDGYIITNERKETSRRGIWAVGDVQDKQYRQAITAASSGCVAALEIERWLASNEK